jgi:hypothetical protein
MDLPTTLYDTKPTDQQLKDAESVGKFYKAIYFQGTLKCYKLQDKPQVSSCNCRKN